MKLAIYYDTSNGHIIHGSSYTDAVGYDAPGAGLSVFEESDVDTDLDTHYIDITSTPVLAARTAMSLVFSPTNKEADADGVDEVVITGIPTGAFLRGELPDGSVSEIINDGQAEISSTVVGKGTIIITHGEHLREVHEIDFV